MSQEGVLAIAVALSLAIAFDRYRRSRTVHRQMQFLHILDVLSEHQSLAPMDILSVSDGMVDPFGLHERLEVLRRNGLVTKNHRSKVPGTAQLTHYAITDLGFEELVRLMDRYNPIE